MLRFKFEFDWSAKEKEYENPVLHFYVDQKTTPGRDYVQVELTYEHDVELKIKSPHNSSALCVDLFVGERNYEDQLCNTRIAAGTLFFRSLPLGTQTYKLDLKDRTGATYHDMNGPKIGKMTIHLLEYPQVPKAGMNEFYPEQYSKLSTEFIRKDRLELRPLANSDYLSHVMLSTYQSRTATSPGVVYFLMPSHVILHEKQLVEWMEVVKRRYDVTDVSKASVQTQACILADISTAYTQSHFYIMDFVYRNGCKHGRESFDDIFIRGDGGDCEDMAKAALNILQTISSGTFSNTQLKTLQTLCQQFVVCACLCQVARPGVSRYASDGHQAHMTCLLIPKAHFYPWCGKRYTPARKYAELRMMFCAGTGRMRCDYHAKTPQAFHDFPLVQQVSDEMCIREEPFFEVAAHLYTQEFTNPCAFSIMGKNGLYGVPFDSFFDVEKRKVLSLHAHMPLTNEIIRGMKLMYNYEHPDLDDRVCAGLAVCPSGSGVEESPLVQLDHGTPTPNGDQFNMYVHKRHVTPQLMKILTRISKRYTAARVFPDINDCYRICLYT